MESDISDDRSSVGARGFGQLIEKLFVASLDEGRTGARVDAPLFKSSIVYLTYLLVLFLIRRER